MTASFTRLFARVVACDLDAAFLERCRETVAQFGRPERLQTSQVADGRTLALADDTADLAFSYITLQHCHHDDALALTAEAVRVVHTGGHVALNFRTWTASDVVLWPAGKIVRALWRVPELGPAHRQAPFDRPARLAGQPPVARRGAGGRRRPQSSDVQIFRSPKRRSFGIAGTTEETFEGVHRSHWWLVATVR